MGIHMMPPNYELVIKPKIISLELAALNAQHLSELNSATYAEAHDGEGVLGSSIVMELGQGFFTPPDTYHIYRGGLVYDISSILPTATIVSAFVPLWGYADFSDTDVIIRLVPGDDLADVLVDADYHDLLAATTFLGGINTAQWVVDSWNNIDLSVDGIAALQAALASGRFRMGIRSSRDISAVPPSGLESVQTVSIEALYYGDPWPSRIPKLTCKYTA